MGVREQFDKIICDEIPEILGVIGVEEENRAAVATQVRDKLNEARVVERLVNVANVHYETPPNIVEIRAHLDKYTIQDKKSLTIQVLAMNDLQNKLKMAMLSNSAITIRGLQADIEAGSTTATESATEDDPDQLTFGDVPAEDPEIDLASEPQYEPVEGDSVPIDDSEIVVESFADEFIAHTDGYVNPHDSIHVISDTPQGAIDAFKARWAEFSRGVTVTQDEDGRFMAEGRPDAEGVSLLGFGETKEAAIKDLLAQLQELQTEEQADDPDITVVEDGDGFRAYGPDYVNDKESAVGFGPTREAAIADYEEDVRLREVATQGNGKNRRKKKEDAEANAAA